jgi:hypothetical protein
VYTDVVRKYTRCTRRAFAAEIAQMPPVRALCVDLESQW